MLFTLRTHNTTRAIELNTLHVYLPENNERPLWFQVLLKRLHFHTHSNLFQTERLPAQKPKVKRFWNKTNWTGLLPPFFLVCAIVSSRANSNNAKSLFIFYLAEKYYSIEMQTVFPLAVSVHNRSKGAFHFTNRSYFSFINFIYFPILFGSFAPSVPAMTALSEIFIEWRLLFNE